MLSAVAARKAAKAIAEAPSTPSPPHLSQAPSLPPTLETTSQSENKPTLKRKNRLSASARLSKCKKVKTKHSPAKHGRNARYFDAGDTAASNTQNRTVSDDSTESTPRIDVTSDSDSSEEEMETQKDIPLSFRPSSITVKAKRAWPPSRSMSDSSDDEEPGPLTAFDPTIYLAPASVKPESLPLSTFRPVLNYNIYSVPGKDSEYGTTGKAVVLMLQPDETVALLGIYSLCVLQGGLSLLGVTLSPSDIKHTVFAPRSSPIPILSWAASGTQGSCTFPVPPAIREQANATAILIERVQTGVEGLGRICKVFENTFNLPRELGALPGADLHGVYIVNNSSKDIHPFALSSSWEVALSSMDERTDSEMSTAPVCLVKGPKKSGKSTLARTLVNRLLNRYRRVAFLECDLGQSEFTPGGLVAINIVENYAFGPPFTHPSLPYRAHYNGASSPRANPSHYLHSIQSLLETYRLDLQFPAPPMEKPPPHDQRIYDVIPLVVNTMGWTKGLGADLNARIEEFVEASHTFQVSNLKENGWPVPSRSHHIPEFPTVSPLMQASVKRYIDVEAVPAEAHTYQTSTDHRHLNILSYFHAVFPESPDPSPSGSVPTQITATRWDAALPLCARYPYEVDYTRAFDRVYLTGAGYEDVVPSELTRVLNGAIVGLVSGVTANIVPRSTQWTTEETSSIPYTPAEPPPDPALSTCHGLALIRGIPLSINLRSPHMHILTPLPTACLSQTRLLVKGEMELPVWGMLDVREDEEGKVAGVEKGQVPYLQWGKREGIGSEKWRVRRNLMRKGQI